MIVTDHRPLLRTGWVARSHALTASTALCSATDWSCLWHPLPRFGRTLQRRCSFFLSWIPANPNVAFDYEEEVIANTTEVQQIATQVFSEYPITWETSWRSPWRILSRRKCYLSCATFVRPLNQRTIWSLWDHSSVQCTDGYLSSERRPTMRLLRGCTSIRSFKSRWLKKLLL